MDLNFHRKSHFLFFQNPLYPLKVLEKIFLALVCQILIILKHFSRKKEYFFVFEWWFDTFQHVKKWQINPFSVGSKYIKVPQFNMFQNLYTKFRVKIQCWELFLFQLFNIKVLSEDFNFQNAQNIYFWQGALGTPKIKKIRYFSHFWINFIIKIKKWTKNDPFFEFLKA